MAQLGESTELFSSNSVHGLLRSAPDLSTHLDNIESMFQVPKNGKHYVYLFMPIVPYSSAASTDELLPCEGKDERYDEIEGRICKLESKLDNDLKRLEKSLKCVLQPFTYTKLTEKSV